MMAEHKQVEKLLPCPFCGGDAVREFREDHSPRKGKDVLSWVVDIICCSCDARGASCMNLDKDAAINAAVAAWNKKKS